MKTIARFECPVDHLESNEWGLYNIYHKAKENGNNTLDFNDVIWDNEIPEIVNFCRNEGIAYFTISSNFSGLLKTMAELQKLGCQIGSVTQVNAPYKDYLTDEYAKIPAIIIKL